MSHPLPSILLPSNLLANLRVLHVHEWPSTFFVGLYAMNKGRDVYMEGAKNLVWSTRVEGWEGLYLCRLCLN